MRYSKNPFLKAKPTYVHFKARNMCLPCSIIIAGNMGEKRVQFPLWKNFKKIDKLLELTVKSSYLWAQFHQHFAYSFYACRCQKHKKILLSHQYLLTLSGSAGVKAVRRTLMKLSHGYSVAIRDNYIKRNELYLSKSKQIFKDISQASFLQLWHFY